MGIKDAVTAYNKLLGYEYVFIITKNKNTEKIKLVLKFSKLDFYHLCGLHKLTDIDELQVKNRKAKENIFDKIFSGYYEDSLFEKSVHYTEITDRIDCIRNIENILDNSNDIFKFNPCKKGYTKIVCDFIIKKEVENNKFFYLTVEDNYNGGKYIGCSCFSRLNSDRDYTEGHTKYYILYKEKENINTHEKMVLFIANGYKVD